MSIPKIAGYPMPRIEPAVHPRVTWQPDPQRAVLLIHDLQEYFLNFYDQNVEPIPTLIDNVLALRHFCDSAGIPVVYTAQPPQQTLQERALLQDWWGPGLTAKPEQAAIATLLAPRPQDIVLTKWRYSAFYRTDLQARMQSQGRDQLLICGVYAHIGCLTTAVDAFMQDIQPFFIGDAMADFSADEHQMALDWVSNRCGVVTNTDSAIRHICPPLPVPDSEQMLFEQMTTLLQLQPDDLQMDDDLLLMGLDSIRLMTLVEGWRRGGLTIEFNDLAERPTLREWWDLIASQRAAA